jgi:hypothetical protein
MKMLEEDLEPTPGAPRLRPLASQPLIDQPLLLSPITFHKINSRASHLRLRRRLQVRRQNLSHLKRH